MSTPKQIISGLRRIFPKADFTREVIVVVTNGVAKIVKTPRPLLVGELEAAIEASPLVVVPSSVTPIQMRKALRLSGLKASVDAALSQADETVQEEWEYATEVLRTDANLIAVAYSIGKTDADIDALFVLAGKQ